MSETVTGAAFAPFLTGITLRDLPEGPMLQARFDTAALSLANLPFDMPVALFRAAPKRRAEFAAGRLLAHLAQVHLGLAPRPIGISQARAPIWPAGLSGSVTHSRGRAALWLSDRPGLTLGIDLEHLPDKSGLRALHKKVLSDAELALIGFDPFAAITTFSAKETLFKALYPHVQRVFWFDAARVVAITADRLTLVLTRDLAFGLPRDSAFDIRVERREDAALTWLSVLPTALPRSA